MIPEGLRKRMLFLDSWTRWKGKTVRSLRERGVLGTVQRAAALVKRLLFERWLLYHLSNPWDRYLDKRFDRRFAVDTAGFLDLPELKSDPRFKHAVNYGPTPRSVFFRMLRRLDVDYSSFVFIDFGCGKGKVLLLAAELPFKQIIGIELSSKLFRVAENNLRNYLGPRTCNAVQLVCMDASEYGIPEERAIYYFYNPFTAEVMTPVLENIRRSLAATPRETYVVYFNHVLKSLLDESGFLTPIKHTSLYSIYRASGV
jgi:hypothetical protein